MHDLAHAARGIIVSSNQGVWSTINKRISALLCLLFIASPVALAQPEGGGFGPVDPRAQQRVYRLEDTGEELPYALFVSSKVRPGEPSPLIVALHGLGGSHETFVRETYRAVALAEESGYILVTPMGYNSAGWYGVPAGGGGSGRGRGFGGGDDSAATDPARVRELSEKDVMNVLAMVRDEFNVDENRIYLMGHSMGGAGALHLGVKHASIWAALAPIAPAAFGLDPNSLASIPNMPVILVVGDADNLVEGARQWAAKLDELDMTHEYHEIAGGDHMSVIADGMPDIFEFFESHSKASLR
jgi:poly(3-hydroxybutyrate) depolymerase